MNAITFSSRDVYHFHFIWKNISTNWPKLTAQQDRHKTHIHTPQEWKRKKRGSINSIELNGKRIESDIKCNTIITTLNISWDYCSRRIFLRFGFNWFFARIYRHTHTRNHKYFHPKYWGFESSQAQVHSLNSPYAMRCDRVYIIKLKYDVHKKAQQHTNNKWT